MTTIQLIILAIVQGLTEFIPVSSSAHLILAPLLLGWEDQGQGIDVAVHVGSLAAVLVYFRGETAMLVRGSVDLVRFRGGTDRDLVLRLGVATIPLVVLGALISLSGLSDVLRAHVEILALASIFFGLLLYVADRRPARDETLPFTWRSVLIIGAAQAVALIPGTSRSGITVTAARFLGFGREASARFSMLIAIPAIIASGAFVAADFVAEGGQVPLTTILLAAGFSFVAALVAIDLFLRLSRQISFTPFVIYRVILGLVILGALYL